MIDGNISVPKIKGIAVDFNVVIGFRNKMQFLPTFGLTYLIISELDIKLFSICGACLYRILDVTKGGR